MARFMLINIDINKFLAQYSSENPGVLPAILEIT